MSRVVIENPILNSPFREPARHFRFSDDGTTDGAAGLPRIQQQDEHHRPQRQGASLLSAQAARSWISGTEVVK